jgi:hypothetical protein
MQTNKLECFPVVAMVTSFWEKLRDFIRGTLLSEGTISASDLSLIHLTDSVERTVEIIKQGFSNCVVR